MPKPFPPLETIHTVAFDFDGVFTDNKVWVNEEGLESVRCDRGDGLAFDFVRAFQKRDALTINFFILSKESNPVVLKRAKKMKLNCFHGVGNKLEFMNNYFQTHNSFDDEPFSGLVYVGNDLNDLPLMRRSGYAIAPADAHPKVKEVATILTQRGGEGFVRAFIEQLLGINDLTEEEIDELISDC
ncbi:MAG: HAD hydrolase family protein [Legionella sp.]|nr:HAD hydrolase family protein [Legionella sp.]